MIKFKFVNVIVCTCLIFQLNAQKSPSFLSDYNQRWVDSILGKMTIDHKIGQLLMPRGNISGKPIDVNKLADWVKKYKIGGVVFFAGPPSVQAAVTNYLQSLSETPMFIGEDFEWGLAMRMDSTDRFPYQMALGAMTDNLTSIESMGEEVARQCKRLGVHINYAPVVDVNNNINNPVINFRSFGSNKQLVADKGLAYMQGMQSQKIISTAKHFPGHGDTNVDSHHDLPIIPHDKARLKEVEFYPFQKLINAGLTGIMTSHLEVPIYEPRKGLAATFSKKILNDLLKNEMGFKGLTFTDAMDMQGAIKNFPKGEAMVEALLAGNDVLETFEDLPLAVEAIKAAVKSGKLTEAEITSKVRKILMAKSWVGLDQYKPIELNGLVADLNSAKSDLLNRKFAEDFITLIKNNNVLPVDKLSKKIAVVSIDVMNETAFQKVSSDYTSILPFTLATNANDSARNTLYEQLKQFDQVIIGLHLKEVRASNKYSITDANQKTITLLGRLPNASLIIFGNLLSLPSLNIQGYKAVAIAYQDTRYTEEAAAQMVFGGLPFKGSLPMTLSPTLLQGQGIQTTATRLSFGNAEQVGIDSKKLNTKLDSIINLGLNEKAFPGGQLVVIRKDKVIVNKAFGFHTFEAAANAKGKVASDDNVVVDSKTDAMDFFDKSKENFVATPPKQMIEGLVSKNDIYDLASVTKVSASALAVMRLMSEGRFSIDNKMGDYIPELKNTNKENLRFRDLVTHRAGLKAWIPFWRDAIDTLATLKKAITINPGLSSEFVTKSIKPSWIKRLFGKKAKTEIDYVGSANKVGLFAKILTPESRVWKPNTFYPELKSASDIRIAPNMYMSKSLQNQLFRSIAESPINPSQGYVYSDLHYYYYPAMIKSLTNKEMSRYLDEVYHEIGAHSLSYNPTEKFPLNSIVETEYDSLFRGSLIHGKVHDEGAIMLNGVSGHAGLFGRAIDVAKLFYMYKNNGSYGGQSFINKSILDESTKYQFPQEKNRRGLFFDKPDLVNNTNSPKLSSSQSYGHSGFTGTFVWVEPAYDILYVFTSNRVYPTRNNMKISTLNIRPAIGDAIIESIRK
jgi:beta-N-acetylhexosaminidase